jgi:hypothetical protein
MWKPWVLVVVLVLGSCAALQKIREEPNTGAQETAAPEPATGPKCLDQNEQCGANTMNSGGVCCANLYCQDPPSGMCRPR